MASFEKFETTVEDFNKEQQAIKNVNERNTHIFDMICAVTRTYLDGAITKDELADQVILTLANNQQL